MSELSLFPTKMSISLIPKIYSRGKRQEALSIRIAMATQEVFTDLNQIRVP